MKTLISSPDGLPGLQRRPLHSRLALRLLRALTVLHRPGRHEDVEVAMLTTGAGVRLHRPPPSVATSGGAR
jgi:hypothetical protein